MTPGAVRVAVAGGVLCAYAGLSLLVGELYPLSRFEFFGFSMPQDSRVVVQLQDGSLREAFALQGWDCPDGLDLLSGAPAGGAPGEVAQPLACRQVARWIAGHPAISNPPMVDVQLVRQVIRYDPPSMEASIAVCPIARCRVAR